MITYPLSLPTSGIESITWTPIDAVAYPRSPFTYDGQSQTHAGQMWTGTVSLPPLMKDDGAEWAGFLASLRGRHGSFLLGDPLRTTPRGVVGGVPVVNGADQTGNELAIRGVTANVTGWLKRGDYVQLGTSATSTLHIIGADVDTDVSGNATLDIWPGIRTSPADGATVTTSNCVGVFKLASNKRSWSIDAPWRYGVSFSVEEAI